MIHVIYHAGCKDGFGAAWAVHRTLVSDRDVEYYPKAYGDSPPEVQLGEPVYIFDFSFSREVMEDLQERTGGFVRLWDHHQSAMKELQDLPYCHFDMSKSGARLAWEVMHGGPVPWLLQYVEDRDLWRWQPTRFSRD